MLTFETVAIIDDHLMSQEKLQKLKVGLGVKAVVKYNFGETYGLATSHLFTTPDQIKTFKTFKTLHQVSNNRYLIF